MTSLTGHSDALAAVQALSLQARSASSQTPSYVPSNAGAASESGERQTPPRPAPVVLNSEAQGLYAELGSLFNAHAREAAGKRWQA